MKIPYLTAQLPDLQLQKGVIEVVSPKLLYGL